MSPVTHFFTGWVFANCFRLERRDRAVVTLACVAPDIDGLGIIPELLTRNSARPLSWFSLYHHSLHNLMFALVVAVIAFTLGTTKWKTGVLAFLSFHIHLIEDVLGSRGPDGYQWPIPYFAPFSSSPQLRWRGQMGQGSDLTLPETARIFPPHSPTRGNTSAKFLFPNASRLPHQAPAENP